MSSSSDDEFRNDKINLNDTSDDESHRDDIYEENQGIAWNKDFYKSSSDDDSEDEELELEEAMRLQKKQQVEDEEYYFEEEFDIVKKPKKVEEKTYKSDGSLLDTIIQMNLEFIKDFPGHRKLVLERIDELEATRGYLLAEDVSSTVVDLPTEQIISENDSINEDTLNDYEFVEGSRSADEAEQVEQESNGSEQLVLDEYVPIEAKPVKLQNYSERKQRNPFAAKSHIKGIKKLEFEIDYKDSRKIDHIGEAGQEFVNEQDSDVEYYNNVVKEKTHRKLARNEEHLAIQQENRDLIPNPYIEDKMDDEEPNAKRQATWKILNNRGLTPRRKKENRNPRVKRKVKYESAMKKLSSTRRVAVDKSKLGAYGGETTGIKVNLSRSIRF